MAQMKKKGVLVLASGRVFQGSLFGADPVSAREEGGEVVFNTSLSGYQEILTDPSYQGQIVAMTPSHIGNYGINPEDVESTRVYLSGFVVQEESSVFSNWRANMSLHAYLERAGVPGISGVDTRALTKYLRTQGAVNGVISGEIDNIPALVKKAKSLPKLDGRDLTQLVAVKETYKWVDPSYILPADNQKAAKQPKNKKKVVVMDFGVKQNILRCLVDRGCEVTVVPGHTPAEEILKHDPDGILISNGPGDPAAVKDGISSIKGLIDKNSDRLKSGKKPYAMFGICLGHQLMGLALGGSTYKLKFGHHGANHPIKDLETGKVDITTQNHGYAVEGQKTAKGEWIVKGNKDAVITHINLNDDAIEGLRHKKLPIYSVQYHPEASSGPHDANHLFDRFLNLMEEKRA